MLFIPKPRLKNLDDKCIFMCTRAVNVLTLLGINTTGGPHMSHITLYTISVLPPRKFGGFHDRVTVDWSTKLTVKFCGAAGGSVCSA